MKQRQFLFRAWRQKQKFMYDNVAVGVKGKIGYRVGKGKYEYESLTPDTTILQYTGRKDKRGKEIFEGDVLKVDRQEDFLTVSWDKSRLGFVLHQLKDKPRNALKWPPVSKIKVVGTIFEEISI